MSQQKLVMVMLMLVFTVHASCVDTGTCIDTILMLTTTCCVDVVGVLVEMLMLMLMVTC